MLVAVAAAGVAVLRTAVRLGDSAWFNRNAGWMLAVALVAALADKIRVARQRARLRRRRDALRSVTAALESHLEGEVGSFVRLREAVEHVAASGADITDLRQILSGNDASEASVRLELAVVAGQLRAADRRSTVLTLLLGAVGIAVSVLLAHPWR